MRLSGVNYIPDMAEPALYAHDAAKTQSEENFPFVLLRRFIFDR